MRYLINKDIHFRNNDGAIWKGDENSVLEPVTLTATTSRLLTYLLEKHGEVASRDDILESVWSSHGLRSSNNSLNKYIADLRKMFSYLELTEEVIITVPRIGFMFSRDISVEYEHTPSDYILPEHNEIEDITNKNDVLHIKVMAGKKKFLILIGLIISGFTPLLLSKTEFGRDVLNLNSLRQSRVYFLGRIDECNLYTIRTSSTEMTSVKLGLAKALAARSRLNCLDNTTFFYQPSDPVIYGYPGRMFLARCTNKKDAPGQFASCDNYYEVNFQND